MSSLSSSDESSAVPQYRKPRADVYTVLLVLALLALIVGILCLWGENAEYEWKYKGGPAVSALTEVGSTVVSFGEQRPSARAAFVRPADIFRFSFVAKAV